MKLGTYVARVVEIVAAYEVLVGEKSLGDVGIQRINNEKGRKEISLDVIDRILYVRRE
jgi:hypothetical protein